MAATHVQPEGLPAEPPASEWCHGATHALDPVPHGEGERDTAPALTHRWHYA